MDIPVPLGIELVIEHPVKYNFDIVHSFDAVIFIVDPASGIVPDVSSLSDASVIEELFQVIVSPLQSVALS